MTAKGKLLFVDDDEKTLEMFRRMFDDKFDVYTAADGFEALNCKEKNKVRVIYTDLQMPKMSGIELCRRIREKDMISIVCAVTGYTKLFELHECREAGFDDYLKKPVDLAVLRRSVNQSVLKLGRWLKHT